MPSVPPYAAVSESVSLAGKCVPRAKGYVNFVLRRIPSDVAALPRREDIPDPVDWLATFYSYPRWMVRRWRKRFGEAETVQLLEAGNTFPKLGIRTNRLKATRGEVAKELEGAGAVVREGVFSPDALSISGMRKITETPAFLDGRVYIQDESSQLAALALAPREGERILDACSGMGGKATHLAEIAGDGADITAVDRDAGRLEKCRENARRLGVESLSLVRGDLLDKGFSPGGPFDGILVDVPCSGLGILRRHPELKWQKKASDPSRLAVTQLHLLRRAADWLSPGGRLVYSTCTLEPEENEDVVRAFLAARKDFSPIGPPRGAIGDIGRIEGPEGYIAAFPHRHDTNGAFVALMRKSPS